MTREESLKKLGLAPTASPEDITVACDALRRALDSRLAQAADDASRMAALKEITELEAARRALAPAAKSKMPVIAGAAVLVLAILSTPFWCPPVQEMFRDKAAKAQAEAARRDAEAAKDGWRAVVALGAAPDKSKDDEAAARVGQGDAKFKERKDVEAKADFEEAKKSWGELTRAAATAISVKLKAGKDALQAARMAFEGKRAEGPAYGKAEEICKAAVWPRIGEADAVLALAAVQIGDGKARVAYEECAKALKNIEAVATGPETALKACEAAARVRADVAVKAWEKERKDAVEEALKRGEQQMASGAIAEGGGAVSGVAGSLADAEAAFAARGPVAGQAKQFAEVVKLAGQDESVLADARRHVEAADTGRGKADWAAELKSLKEAGAALEATRAAQRDAWLKVAAKLLEEGSSLRTADPPVTDKDRLAKAATSCASAAIVFEAAGDAKSAGLSLHTQAWTQEPDRNASGSWDAAAELYARAAALRKSASDLAGQGESLHARAVCLRPGRSASGTRDLAAAAFAEAAAVREAAGDARGQGESLHQQADVLTPTIGSDADWALPQSLFEKAAELRAKAGDKAGQAESLDSVAICMISHEPWDYGQAAAIRGKAAELYEAAGDRKRQGRSVSAQALNLWNQGDASAETIEALFKKASDLARETGDKEGQAWNLQLLADYFEPDANPAGDWQKSAELYRKAGGIYVEAGLAPSAAWAWYRAGRCFLPIYNEAAPWDAPIADFEKAEALWREAGISWGVSLVLNDRGICSHHLKEWEKSRIFFEGAIEFAQKANEKDREATTWGNLGWLYTPEGDWKGDPKKAQKCYETEAALWKAHGNPAKEQLATYNQARCVDPSVMPPGDWVAASGLYAKAAALAGAIGNFQAQGNNLINAGYCVDPRINPTGDIRKAAAFYEAAVEAYGQGSLKAGQADALERLANVWRPDLSPGGDWELASDFYRRAAECLGELKLPVKQGRCLFLRGYCYAPDNNPKGSWDKATAFMAEALPFLSETEDAQTAANCYEWLGTCYRPGKNSTPDVGKAAGYFEKAVRLYRSLNDTSNLANALSSRAWCLRGENNTSPQWGTAGDLYLEAANLYGTLGKTDDQGFCLNESAWCHQPDHWASGTWTASAERFEAGARARQQSGNKLSQAICHNNAAICWDPRKNSYGDWNRAASNYKQAADLYRQLADKAKEASALFQYAYHAIRTEAVNNTEDTRAAFRRAAQLFREIGDETSASNSESWLQ